MRPSSAALADLDRLYAKFSTSETEESSLSEQEERRENSTKNFLGWEKLLAQAESEVPDSFSQENPAISSFYQDPSFCSGKFSARFMPISTLRNLVIKIFSDQHPLEEVWQAVLEMKTSPISLSLRVSR